MKSLEALRAEIEKICQVCKRSSEEVKILAVSKLQSIEKINGLVSQGQLDFGENYVQELIEKKKQFPDSNLRWHFIGHLQKNKVKTVMGVCELIHSVDSLALAQEIHKRASANGHNQKILLEVNLSGENSKEGFEISVLRNEISQIRNLNSLKVCGLMTMPPFVDNPEDNRHYFKTLKSLLLELKTEFNMGPDFSELSMGTSQDFSVAIEEGSTWIRVGTTLFGSRPSA